MTELLQMERRQAPDAARTLSRCLNAAERVLGCPIDKDQPLTEAGLDSLGAVELHRSLEAEFMVQLPATVAYDYPTAAALAQYITSLDTSFMTLGEQNPVLQ